MESPTLDDLMAFNEHLVALADADVPLDMGLDGNRANLSATLDKVGVEVVRQVSRGASLSEALQAEDQTSPSEYRNLMLLGVRSGNLSAALEDSCRSAASGDRARYSVRISFYYPLLICFLAYLGMVGFCLFFVPVLERTYEGFQVESQSGLHVLQSLRDTLPYWVAFPPVGLLFIIAGALRSRSRTSAGLGKRSWLPGMSLAISHQRWANFAEILASLLEAGVETEEGLLIAARASGAANLIKVSDKLAEAIGEGRSLENLLSTRNQFPPLLNWALLPAQSAAEQSQILRTAAKVYRTAADQQTWRIQHLLPAVTCVVIGGGVTLLYGMALFLPVVELYLGLAFK